MKKVIEERREIPVMAETEVLVVRQRTFRSGCGSGFRPVRSGYPADGKVTAAWAGT